MTERPGIKHQHRYLKVRTWKIWMLHGMVLYGWRLMLHMLPVRRLRYPSVPVMPLLGQKMERTGLGRTNQTLNLSVLFFYGGGGSGIAWNGSMWLAVGYGSFSIAWSTDGMSWMETGGEGLNNNIFGNSGANAVACNSSMWVVVGQAAVDGVAWLGNSANSIAWSPNGTTWNGLGKTIFSVGYAIAWNGSIWVAGGAGTNSLAWSEDGKTWNGLGKTIFI